MVKLTLAVMVHLYFRISIAALLLMSIITLCLVSYHLELLVFCNITFISKSMRKEEKIMTRGTTERWRRKDGVETMDEKRGERTLATH